MAHGSNGHPGASDLDLVALASPEQKAAVSKLREALETSSLPFRVDLFIWDEVPETFRDPIREKHVVLQESEKKEKGQIRGTEERMNWVNSTVGEFCPFAYGKSLPEKTEKKEVFQFMDRTESLVSITLHILLIVE